MGRGSFWGEAGEEGNRQAAYGLAALGARSRLKLAAPVAGSRAHCPVRGIEL